MRPLRLEVEGLTAFRERQVIDLAELGLFVITGPTGSGKTSILDAITLALYGEIPRTKQGEIKDLITHGMNRARVQLDFEVGKVHYRVVRQMPRNGAQSGTLERIEGERAFPEVDRSGIKAVNERVEQIVGLEYDAFKRAVLLPQGEFSDFLNGDAGRRERILSRLLDLERYERAGNLARQRAAALNTRARDLTGSIEGEYRDATPEHLSQVEGEVIRLDARVKRLQEVYEKAAALVQQADNAATEARALATPLGDLARQRQCLENTSRDWDTLEPALRRTRQALAEAEEALTGAAEQREAARQSLEETKLRCGDAAQIATVQTAAEQWKQAESRLLELTGEMQTAMEALAAAQEALTAREQALQNAREQEQRARQQESEAREALARATESQRNAQTRVQAEAKVREAKTAHERASGLLATAVAQLAEMKERLESARAHLDHVKSETYAAALRMQLRPGEACPVCTQRVSSVPPGGEAARGTIDQAAKALRACEEQHHRQQAEVTRLSGIVGQWEGHLRSCEEALRGLPEAPTLSEATTAVTAAEGAHGVCLGALREAEADLKDASQKRESASNTLERTKASQEERQRSLERAQEDRDKGLRVLQQAFSGELPANLTRVLAARKAELEGAEQKCATAENAVEAIRKTRDSAHEKLLAEEQRLGEIQQALAGSRATLEALLGSLRAVPNAPALPDVPRPEPLVPAHLQALRAWSEEILTAGTEAHVARKRATTAAVEALQELMREDTVPVSPEVLGRILTELNRVLGNAQRVLGEVEAQRKQLSLRIQEREKKQIELAEARKKEQNYQRLGQELQTDRFLAFLISEGLQHLAITASRELSTVSGNRYELKAAGRDFAIIDHANADEERCTATLSGGETFLASLSLALALSGSITELAGHTASTKLDAVFIDEGFGSLDPQSLEVVVDALERLQDGDRMVGVITHVPLLAERIPNGLEVERNGSSSRVTAR